MKSALAGALERARSTFSTIGLGQKVVIGLLLAGLLLGGFFFYRWITTPTQAPLFSNPAPPRPPFSPPPPRPTPPRSSTSSTPRVSPTPSPTAGRRSWWRRTRSTTCG